MKIPLFLSRIIVITLICGPIIFFSYTGYQTQSVLSWTSNVDKKVAAFYYPWYGNTTDYSATTPYNVTDNTDWWHWNGAEINSYAPPLNASSANTPVWGYYDSADTKIIETHLRQAEWAGIDAFVSSYWGINGQELKNLKTMVEIARAINSNLTIAPYFETGMAGMTEKSPADQQAFLLSEFRSLYDFMTNPLYSDYLWFENGKPVVWIYVVRFVSAEVWMNVINALTAENKEFFLVGDRPNRNSAHIQQFQALHQYDVYAPIRDNNYFEIYSDIKHDCMQYNQVFVAGVGPAYNDTLVRSGNAPFGRENGKYYENRWNDALSLNPDWISIVSWNEWHEGSEIEPSLENGDLALNQTRQFIQEFKSGNYSTLHPNAQGIMYFQMWKNKIYIFGGIILFLGICAWILRVRAMKMVIFKHL